LYVKTYNRMGYLSEEVGRICNILEDAKEEQDWEQVQQVIDSLEELYNKFDREESGFNYDYD